MAEPEEKKTRKIEREIERLLEDAKKSADKENYSRAVALYQESARLAKLIRDKRSVDFCLDAARYSRKLGNDFKTGWSYKCAADHSFDFEDFNNTVNFATEAIKYFLKSNSMYAVQWCYNLIGKAGEKLNDQELAVKNYRKSLEIEYSEEIDRKLRELLKKVSEKRKNPPKDSKDPVAQNKA